MTTITREHLELAALAAGMTPLRMSDDGRGLLVSEQPDPWRPHTDIADAARLAVRLDMQVEIWRGWRCATVAGWMDWGRSRHDGTELDKERAYCEAITICAAAIGQRMREGGR